MNSFQNFSVPWNPSRSLIHYPPRIHILIHLPNLNTIPDRLTEKPNLDQPIVIFERRDMENVELIIPRTQMSLPGRVLRLIFFFCYTVT